MQLVEHQRIVETQTIPIRAGQKLGVRAQQRPARGDFRGSQHLRPFDDDPLGHPPQLESQPAIVRLQSEFRRRGGGDAACAGVHCFVPVISVERESPLCGEDRRPAIANWGHLFGGIGISPSNGGGGGRRSVGRLRGEPERRRLRFPLKRAPEWGKPDRCFYAV